MVSLNGIFETFIAIGVAIGLLVWGLFAGYNKWFVNHDIKVSKPLIPTIELVIKNNKVDTLYVYKVK